mmetsp:Transcript_33095/g.101733  ORF Transcript_33095/g.101733 Transcript_33095/m.101733 type:complete len:293 (-) Transcript_33095:288-1166(-)
MTICSPVVMSRVAVATTSHGSRMRMLTLGAQLWFVRATVGAKPTPSKGGSSPLRAPSTSSSETAELSELCSSMSSCDSCTAFHWPAEARNACHSSAEAPSRHARNGASSVCGLRRWMHVSCCMPTSPVKKSSSKSASRPGSERASASSPTAVLSMCKRRPTRAVRFGAPSGTWLCHGVPMYVTCRATAAPKGFCPCRTSQMISAMAWAARMRASRCRRAWARNSPHASRLSAGSSAQRMRWWPAVSWAPRQVSLQNRAPQAWGQSTGSGSCSSSRLWRPALARLGCRSKRRK